ncbi:RHOMBOID-like protein 6 [Cardamine amara subsp. amara]|uniref:RHOMBOID-like protein n=1 Tax=Cardamine amara subsp. amara TaxID=228776 RepID=A0ABD1B846_CARAN
MSSRGMERSGKNRGGNQYTSWLSPTIVVANVAVFIVVMFINDCPKTTAGTNGDCVAKFLGRFSFQPLRENPLLGPSSSTLDKMGALEWRKVVQGNEKWRLVTSMWLHGGIFHLLTNMINVIVIGVRLEQQFGFLRVGIIYLISGFGGSILSALFLQNSISVGASGALLGLIGAMLSELLINWTIDESKFCTLFTILFTIAMDLAIGLLPWVDNFAHIGGFLTGFFVGFVLLIQPQFGWEESRNSSQYGGRGRAKYNPCQYMLFFIGAVFVVAGLTVGTVMLYKGENGNKHCKWCHRLDCYPTSKWSC